MRQILSQRYQAGGKSGIQLARPHAFNLMDGEQVVQFQLNVRLPAAELAKGVDDQPVPGQARGNSNPKRADFAVRDPFGTQLRFLDFSQDPPRIGQK